MSEQVKQLENLLSQIDQAIQALDIDRDRKRSAELQAAAARPDFWNDPQKAASTNQQLAALQQHVSDWDNLHRQTEETLDLAKLEDPSLSGEIEASYHRLVADFDRRQFELQLSGPYDKNSAIVSLYAGTGGTDAQDWAQMLERMYLRYAERVGYKTQILDRSPGEEAGIKSLTMEVVGPYAFGRLKGEKGVHRLVRLSPFNADHLRQTSFALVDVMPEIEGPGELEIDPTELRTDVFRSGGHGGQSVNTTDSAVRLTHVPTGTVVTIQNERSQLQNKEKALQVMRGKLAALLLEQHKDKLAELRGVVQSAAWGQQIRSYVLHPYTKVKDHRSGYETSQAQKVLDGDLDQLIEANLNKQIGVREQSN